MGASYVAAARSFATTFVSVFVASVPVAALLSGDWSWVQAAAASALIAALRTVIAALDPGQPLYGVGVSAPAAPVVVDPFVEDAAPVEGE
jgi:hypothetical protein